MVSNCFLSFIRKDINFFFFNLKCLKYPLILVNIKTNGVITLSKYLIKYLELVFVSTNFEMTIFSTLKSQIFIGFLQHKFFLLLILLLYPQKKDFVIIF